MPDVTALGELLIDFTTTDLRDGYPVLAAHPGGAPANFLAALSACGCSTALLGKVGQDAFGDLLLDTLRQAGIDTSGVRQDSSVFTTLAFVTLDQKGDRSFSFARKPGADTCLTPGELDLECIRRSRVFHFGTLSLTDEPARSATETAVAFAQQQNKLLSFDPNLRLPLWNSPEDAKSAMLWGLHQADVVKLSGEEAQFLFGRGPEQAADMLLNEFGVKLCYVTLGAEGCYFATPRARGHVPCPPGIRPIDTTGAGDIFGGSAMSRLLSQPLPPEDLDGDALRSIVTFACCAASLSTQRPGGISSVPPLAQVLTLAEQYK